MPVAHSRKYCCICSNFRGKNVDGAIVTLHRFLSNNAARRIWLKRARLVMEDFVYTEHSRLCSLHFVGGGPTTEHPYTSVFPQKVFKTSRVDIDNSAVTINNQEAESEESPIYTCDPFVSSVSTLQTSVMFHDYCEQVDEASLADNFHKSVQTTETDFIKMQDVAVQFGSNKVKYVNTYTQTETTPTYKDQGTQVKCPLLVYEDVRGDNQKVMFYTGIPDSDTFEALFDELKDDAVQQTARNGSLSDQGRPRHLRIKDEFFMFLMRLRLGLYLEDLADRFGIAKSTCSVIINKWIDYFDIQLSFLVKWPSRKAVNDNMPQAFVTRYSNCRVILDCTEIKTETPASLQHKSLMYSNYKSHMTWNGLIGISLAGVVTFVSDLWAGSVSDKVITKESNLLCLCEKGDALMVDKGILISDMTTSLGIQLIISPFKHGKRQLSKREVDETRSIANSRIHVERQMEQIKNFNILRTIIPISMTQQLSKIWKLCARLTNLQPPLCT